MKAFGVNAVVMPPGYASGPHFHDRQEELYLVHRGEVEFTFGEGDAEEYHVLGPGGLARVDAATARKIRNVGDGDAVYLIAGGKDGYVGRDGRLPEARRRGVGAGVSSWLLQRAFERGAELAHLNPDTDAAARIYGRLGFTELSGHDIYIDL